MFTEGSSITQNAKKSVAEREGRLLAGSCACSNTDPLCWRVRGGGGPRVLRPAVVQLCSLTQASFLPPKPPPVPHGVVVDSPRHISMTTSSTTRLRVEVEPTDMSRGMNEYHRVLPRGIFAHPAAQCCWAEGGLLRSCDLLSLPLSTCVCVFLVATH